MHFRSDARHMTAYTNIFLSLKPNQRLHALDHNRFLHQIFPAEYLVHGLELGRLSMEVIRGLVGIPNNASVWGCQERE